MNLLTRPLTLLASLLLLTLVTAALPPAAPAAQDESTSFQVNPGHTGFASGGTLERPPLQERWTRALGDSTSFPLVAGGRVFVVASVATIHDPAPQDGILYALDAASGATLWSRAVGAKALIAYDGGRVFVAERDGTVRGLAATSGALLWSRDVEEPFVPYPPVAVGGVVYVSSVWSYGYMWALSGQDGATLWRTRQDDSGMPAVDGSYVYAADGRANAFWRGDGRLAWSTGSECFSGSGRTIADGARLVAPYNGRCGTKVDAATGLGLSVEPRSDAAAIAGDVAVARDGAVLRTRSVGSGTPLWEFAAAGDPLVSPPLIVNETVYAGGASGTLYAVDLRTGAELWRGAVAGGVAAAGVAGMAAGGGALVVPAGGTVSSLVSAQVPRPGLALHIDGGPDGPTASVDATFAFGSDTLFAGYRCRLDGGAWSPCVAASTYLGLAEGPHVFEVQSLDGVSGDVIALAARGWSVDTTAPVATISRASSPVLNVNRVLAWIALEPRDREARLECRLDGAAWSICQTGAYDGDVEYGGLSQGSHRLDVRARDPLGNVQAVPATRSWLIDTIAPRLTVSAAPAQPAQTTPSTAAAFTFSADEAVRFQCSLDDSPYADCASPFTVSGLHDGSHAFRLQARDVADNLTSSVRFWEIADPASSTTPPDTLLVRTPPSLTASRYAELGFVSDETAYFSCRLDGGDWETCSSSYSASYLTHGTHVFEVRARDMAGNVDPTPARWTWFVDTIAPHTTAQLAPGSGPQTGYRFTFTADKPGSTFECALDDASWAACASGILYEQLSPGRHELRVRATDPAGNLDNESPSIGFSVPAPDPPVTPADDPPPEPDPDPGTPPVPTVPAAPSEPPAPTAQTPVDVAADPGAGGRGGAGSADAAARGTGTLLPPVLAPAAATPPPDAHTLAGLIATSARSTLDDVPRSRLRSGRPVKVHLVAIGAGRVTLTITARQGRRTYTVARAQASFGAAGTRVVALRFTAAGRRALRGTRSVRLQLRAVVTPRAGRAASARAGLRV